MKIKEKFYNNVNTITKKLIKNKLQIAATIVHKNRVDHLIICHRATLWYI